jgi:hypothetical protein
MRRKVMVLGLAVGMLGVAGCGSSSSSSKTVPSAAKGTRPARIYRLALTGNAETPPGAPTGRGFAVIAIHGTSTVCWRFAHLHGFTSATFARIHLGTTGKSGNVVVPLSTGPALHHRGCVPVNPVLIKAIECDPRGYYVNIHSTKYPGGAVRAQL